VGSIGISDGLVSKELATRQLASYNQLHMPRNRACGKGKLYKRGCESLIPGTPAAVSKRRKYD
jgi:hypothetical protein